MTLLPGKMIMKKLFTLLLSTCLFVASAQAAKQESDEEIIERIKPVGSVHVAGAVAASASAAGPRSGSDIYNTNCVACHGAGVLGAPKKDDAAVWGPRLEKGFDTVWQNAINGIGGMPPMGTCSNCSNDDIKAAIEFMIEGI